MMSFVVGINFNSICTVLIILPACLESLPAPYPSFSSRIENDASLDENSKYNGKNSMGQINNNSSFHLNLKPNVPEVNANNETLAAAANSEAVNVGEIQEDPHKQDSLLDRIHGKDKELLGRDPDPDHSVQHQIDIDPQKQQQPEQHLHQQQDPVPQEQKQQQQDEYHQQQQKDQGHQEQQQQEKLQDQQQLQQHLPVNQDYGIKKFILPPLRESYFDNKANKYQEPEPSPAGNQKIEAQSLNVHLDESKSEPVRTITTKSPSLQNNQIKILSDVDDVKSVDEVLDGGNDDEDDVQGYNDAGPAGQDLMETSYEQMVDREDETNVEDKINELDEDDMGDDQNTDIDDDDWYYNRDSDNKAELEMEKNENGDAFVETEKINQSDFQWPDENTLTFVDSKNHEPVFQEEVVEYKMMNGHVNTPSSMVLFYTWVILIVLLTVIAVSVFKYRCKGRNLMNGFRSHRNGSHRNSDEAGKKLLENVYT